MAPSGMFVERRQAADGAHRVDLSRRARRPPSGWRPCRRPATDRSTARGAPRDRSSHRPVRLTLRVRALLCRVELRLDQQHACAGAERRAIPVGEVRGVGQEVAGGQRGALRRRPPPRPARPARTAPRSRRAATARGTRGQSPTQLDRRGTACRPGSSSRRNDSPAVSMVGTVAVGGAGDGRCGGSRRARRTAPAAWCPSADGDAVQRLHRRRGAAVLDLRQERLRQPGALGERDERELAAPSRRSRMASAERPGWSRRDGAHDTSGTTSVMNRSICSTALLYGSPTRCGNSVRCSRPSRSL